MKTLCLALRTVLYMTGFLLFFGWVALRIRSFDQALGGELPHAARVPGVLLMALGGAIGLLCAGVFFARGHGTPALFDAPRAFVASGPYQYVRNPMYIGGLALLAGFGLYCRSISILLLVLVLLAAMHLLVVLYEEPVLTRKFGAPYQKYLCTVRRWVPQLPNRRRAGKDKTTSWPMAKQSRD